MINAGQCVRISEAEAGVIIEGAALLGGGNVYKVLRAFDDGEDGEIAWVKDPAVHVPGGPLCAECPLWYAGRCGLACLD